MKVQTLLLSVVVAASGAAFAQAPAPKDPAATPRVDQRQANQEQRIQQGVASGQLTPKEAARLEKGEQRIDNAEDRAKADGKVTAQERRHLDHMQDRESRAIYKEKHDRQTDMDHDGKRDRHNQGQGGARGPGGHGRK